MDITCKPSSSRKNKTGAWRTYIPQTDYNACIGCGTCARVCPENCIVMKKKRDKQKPQTDYDYCKGCGICATECPVKCIKMKLEAK